MRHFWLFILMPCMIYCYTITIIDGSLFLINTISFYRVSVLKSIAYVYHALYLIISIIGIRLCWCCLYVSVCLISYIKYCSYLFLIILLCYSMFAWFIYLRLFLFHFMMFEFTIVSFYQGLIIIFHCNLSYSLFVTVLHIIILYMYSIHVHALTTFTFFFQNGRGQKQ